MMRCGDEDDRSFLGDFMRPSWSDFTKEEIDDQLEKNDGEVVCKIAC